ncbi:MAG: MarR family transcriptional regulator [Actinobacteria bacterium]|nr:MarR family transcriptional regulator [Actinomycetota bacterium]MBV8599474.1 MarR family transcriptional regulator [Actinomycetota bacterium]
MNPSKPQIQAPTCLPAELASSPVFLLGRLGYELKRRATAALEAVGYALYDFSVLSLLAESPCQAQGEIADLLNLDRGQLVGLLDSLEERQLIERQRDPKDRRRQTVKLTRAGRQELGRLRGLVARIEDDFLAALDLNERGELEQLLARVARHIDPRFAERGSVAVAS